MQQLFFELIQVALGKRIRLSRLLSDEEWREVYLRCHEQTIAGIAFTALDALSKEKQKIPIELLYEWIGISEQIRQQNNLLNIQSKEIQLLLSSKGIECSILKGQGISKYYGNNLQYFRQSGDIDVYVDCGRGGAIRLARELGQKDLEWDYKHVKITAWSKVEVELHYRVENVPNLICNHKLQNWIKNNKNLLFEKHDELVMPNVHFNLIYVLIHIYRHFLYEGVGLRQLMDYYFVLVKANGDFGYYAHGETVKDVLCSLKMLKFSSGLMWVLNKVFLLDKKLMICEPSEKEGEFIQEVIMNGGNFGHSDERINRYTGKIGYIKKVMKHNMHIFSHYPSELLWSPIWMVYHKCWKWTRMYRG